MFGGFVFLGICSRPGRFLHPLYTAFGTPADKGDWMDWIYSLFSPDCNLQALSVQTRRPLDVWVSIPYPDSHQTDFGYVNGRRLNFQIEDDRYEAVKWWMDCFLERFEQETSLKEKLQLRGFLWTRESIDAKDEHVVIETNKYVRANGYLSMWLPHYGGSGAIKFNRLGFHVAAFHSNYYGNTDYGVEWIDQTALFARLLHAGMQIIYGKGVLYNDTHLFDYLNLGLPDKNDYMRDCFLVYQFPNQKLKDMCISHPDEYKLIYSFIKGDYDNSSYPGITY